MWLGHALVCVAVVVSEGVPVDELVAVALLVGDCDDVAVADGVAVAVSLQ